MVEPSIQKWIPSKIPPEYHWSRIRIRLGSSLKVMNECTELSNLMPKFSLLFLILHPQLPNSLAQFYLVTKWMLPNNRF